MGHFQTIIPYFPSDRRTETTTFLCEGCRGRFPESRLWPQSTRWKLEDAVANRGVRGPFYNMVCSEECARLVPVKKFTDWIKVCRDGSPLFGI